jgi:hypothetical protein
MERVERKHQDLQAAPSTAAGSMKRMKRMQGIAPGDAAFRVARGDSFHAFQACFLSFSTMFSARSAHSD